MRLWHQIFTKGVKAKTKEMEGQKDSIVNNCIWCSGSEDLQCNQNGMCRCKPGVTGEKCDRCQANFYDFGPSGCRYVKQWINLVLKKFFLTALGDLNIITHSYVVCGKIMFSVMFVCLFAGVTTTYYAIGHSQPPSSTTWNCSNLFTREPYPPPSCTHAHSRRLTSNRKTFLFEIVSFWR